MVALLLSPLATVWRSQPHMERDNDCRDVARNVCATSAQRLCGNSTPTHSDFRVASDGEGIRKVEET